MDKSMFDAACSEYRKAVSDTDLLRDKALADVNPQFALALAAQDAAVTKMIAAINAVDPTPK
jgi:hypothetical protein